MPNWVYTYLDITGKEEDLREFIDKARQPYVTHHRGDFVVNEDGTKSYDETIIRENIEDDPLSFWNFKKPTDLEAYFGNSKENPEGYDTWTMEERLAHSLQFSSNGWYDWNVREWGTKWDASQSELVESSDPKNGHISYRFETAWSPAEGAFQAMVEQHPSLHFTFNCEEEQGWGVEYESKNGELVETNSWDIPDSHADYVERDNVDSCICSYEDDKDEWYEDCPADLEEAK